MPRRGYVRRAGQRKKQGRPSPGYGPPWFLSWAGSSSHSTYHQPLCQYHQPFYQMRSLLKMLAEPKGLKFFWRAPVSLHLARKASEAKGWRRSGPTAACGEIFCLGSATGASYEKK